MVLCNLHITVGSLYRAQSEVVPILIIFILNFTLCISQEISDTQQYILTRYSMATIIKHDVIKLSFRWCKTFLVTSLFLLYKVFYMESQTENLTILFSSLPLS